MLFLSTAPFASEQAEVVFVLETTIEVETLAQVASNKEQVTVLSWYHKPTAQWAVQRGTEQRPEQSIRQESMQDG